VVPVDVDAGVDDVVDGDVELCADAVRGVVAVHQRVFGLGEPVPGLDPDADPRTAVELVGGRRVDCAGQDQVVEPLRREQQVQRLLHVFEGAVPSGGLEHQEFRHVLAIYRRQAWHGTPKRLFAGRQGDLPEFDLRRTEPRYRVTLSRVQDDVKLFRQRDRHLADEDGDATGLPVAGAFVVEPDSHRFRSFASVVIVRRAVPGSNPPVGWAYQPDPGPQCPTRSV